ncbi:TonB-dependent receptor domain-containing protein [Sphingomonas sp.]|uniref:TonB-dependent receptor domain-containing protein n=1 Tax=Sphingomonas sp. TaxID=28214 RepID=UPI003B00B973
MRLHARIGIGFGIPQAGQLFVTPQGTFGNNVDLRTQRNTGVDLGAELTLGDDLKAEVTGYQEWFRNELVSQSAGVNLQTYTSNVPRSRHRGIEIGLDWRPLPAALPGARVQASYSYNDQYYTDFRERLTAGPTSVVLDRAGNAIPGVIPTFVNARVGYDHPAGGLAGLGAFGEVTYRQRYFIDNANLLRVPGITLVNLNLHYDPLRGDGWWSRLSLFASVQNLFDRTYIGSASIVSDGIAAGSGVPNGEAVLRSATGSIYAGQPRTVYAGVKSRF